MSGTSERKAGFWDAMVRQWGQNSHFVLTEGVFGKTVQKLIREELAKFTTQLTEATRILNLGAGTGIDVYLPTGVHADELYAKMTAIDVSAAMLDQNPAHEKKVHDLESGIPYPDEEFDVVLELFLFRYIQDFAAHWNEIVRVLKPNGVAMLFDFNQIGLAGEIIRPETIGSFSTHPTVLTGCKDIEAWRLAGNDTIQLYFVRARKNV